MPIQLSENFTYRKLLRFTAPSIIMMILTSIYHVVDGLFVSNFVGATPFAAINIIMPFLMILNAVGFMLGAGGSALVAKLLGENRKEKANRVFSMLVYATMILGISFSALGCLFIKPLAVYFGAQGKLLEDCLSYAHIILPGTTAFMLQYVFQSFLVTAEKPKLGLAITTVAGLTNVVLDAFFIIVCGWGLAGAAWATLISQLFGGLVPLIYFIRPGNSTLRLGKTAFYPRELLNSCFNGASEFLSNISISAVNALYNFQLLRIVGESGVVAYGIVAYVNFIFVSSFIGYSIGSNPIVSYHYGAGNRTELKSLFQKNIRLIGLFSLILAASAEILAVPLAKLFVGYDVGLFSLTVQAFRIYSLSFLFVGFNIYASAFFTALNNGLISAIISFCRLLLFESLCILVLPLFWGLNGIWFSVVVAEILALFVSFFFLTRYRKHYGY